VSGARRLRNLHAKALRPKVSRCVKRTQFPVVQKLFNQDILKKIHMVSPPGMGSLREFQAALSTVEYKKRDLAAMASATRTIQEFKSHLPRSSLTLNPQLFEFASPEDSTLSRSTSLGPALAETHDRFYTHKSRDGLRTQPKNTIHMQTKGTHLSLIICASNCQHFKPETCVLAPKPYE